jgi:hypothetical protein
MQVKHEHEKQLNEIKKQNPIAWQIIVKLREIDKMNEIGFDTMWEKDLLKYRTVSDLLTKTN